MSPRSTPTPPAPRSPPRRVQRHRGAAARLVAYSRVPALDPATLDAQAQAAVDALLEAGASRNTTCSYASALKYWAGWFQLRYRRPFTLPVPVPAVVQFIVDHVERELRRPAGPAPRGTRAARARRARQHLVHDLPAPLDEQLVAAGLKGRLGALSLATVQHRLSVLSKAHQTRRLANPTRDPAVQALLHGTRRAYAARDVRPAAKDALTREPLEQMLATCTDGLIGERDRAVLLFGFSSGGRRRAEIAAADLSRLTRLGPSRYVYQLGRTKTQPSGADRDPNAYKPVQGTAGRALADWLEASGLRSGRLFRRIRRRGPPSAAEEYAAEPLSPQAVWRIVKRRAALAGLRGDYGAHSLRAGFVTEAGRQNISLGDTMALTSHRDVKSVIRYHRPGAIGQTGAANLYDVSAANRGPRDPGRSGVRQRADAQARSGRRMPR